jgi:hypothetical protein
VNTLYCLEEWRGKQRISPPGDNFTPRGQNSPLGDKFTPGGQIRPWGQSFPHGMKLRMGLRVFIFFLLRHKPRYYACEKIEATSQREKILSSGVNAITFTFFRLLTPNMNNN